MTIGNKWERTDEWEKNEEPGCCASCWNAGNCNDGDLLYDGQSKGLDDCKSECVDRQIDCGWISYFDSTWCSVIRNTSDCSEILSGPTDCGSSGLFVHVHKYLPRHGN